MQLFAIFALLVCAVLALTGASPVGAELGPAAAAPLGGPDSAPPALREPRSASHKKKSGGGGYGHGYYG